MEKVKLTIRIPSSINHDIDASIGQFPSKSEFFALASEHYLNFIKSVADKQYSLDDVDHSGNKASQEHRCQSGYGDGINRCGLEVGHDGPCVFFCEDPGCKGYAYPNKILKHERCKND